MCLTLDGTNLQQVQNDNSQLLTKQSSTIVMLSVQVHVMHLRVDSRRIDVTLCQSNKTHGATENTFTCNMQLQQMGLN